VLRYFALSTALVLAAILVLLAIPRFGSPPSRGPQYHGGRATPSAGTADRGGRRVSEGVTGAAPWALSAVPECFHETASFAGPPAFARAHLPAAARRLRAGRYLVADCTLLVSIDSAELRRGDDDLRIPAPSRFYVAGGRLVLDQEFGRREEVRIYAPVPTIR
jgi:hypothetical protein